MKLLLTAVLLAFFTNELAAQNQQVTEKDFRLLIDGKQYNDSINIIAKDDLLKMKTVTANFSWITVKDVIIYYQPPMCEAMFQRCAGNIVCTDAKEFIRNLKPGYIIAIAADEAVNKQGSKVYIQELFFRIK